MLSAIFPWVFAGGAGPLWVVYLSPEEHIKLRRARMADVHSQALMQRLDVIKKNQSQVRKLQYSQKYEVGDYLLQWTANPKVGVYGKLAYKCTGPYLIVGIHDRNPDVYRLVPLTDQPRDPTSHHVRGLVPYISARWRYPTALTPSTGTQLLWL